MNKEKPQPPPSRKVNMFASGKTKSKINIFKHLIKKVPDKLFKRLYKIVRKENKKRAEQKLKGKGDYRG